MLNTRINVANLSLQGISDAGSQVKAASAGATLTLDSNGQTAGQATAMASFTQVIALLNTEVGGRYMFSRPRHRYASDGVGRCDPRRQRGPGPD